MTSDYAQQVRVEEINWKAALPIVRLFGAFRTAIRVPNLLIALLLVVMLWLLGQTLGGTFGLKAYQNEIVQYERLSPQSYREWLKEASQANLQQVGVFDAAMEFQVRVLRGITVGLLGPRFAAGPNSQSPLGQPSTIGGGLHDLLGTLPGWLWTHHRGFLLLYGAIGLALWALLGGAAARATALQITRNQRVSIAESLRYAAAHWSRFIITPLLPLILAGMTALIPVVFGAVFFNLPGLDLVGGLTMIVPIVFSGIIALFLLLTVVASPLLYPALAVESTDCFDALSRACGYVLGRPWQWLSYNLVMWTYGAAMCLLIGLFFCLSLGIAHSCLDLGVMRDTGSDQLDAIFASGLPGQSAGNEDGTDLGILSKLTVGTGTVWVYLTTMMVSAFAVSFYFSANTWIYLLLRQSVDGTEVDELFIEKTEQTTVSSEPSSNEST